MSKFSERQRKKIKSSSQKSGTNYALGCLLAIVIIPIVAFAVYYLKDKGVIAEKKTRVKTQYEEGLVGSVNKSWILIGHEFAAENKQIVYTVKSTKEEIPDNLNMQYRKKDADEFLGTMQRTEANTYSVTINAEDMGAGVLELEAVATSDQVSGKKWTSEPVTINVSYGMYVAWTIDWEGMSVTQYQLNQMSQISDNHYRLPMTHFYNPRNWVALGSSQANLQTNYVISRRDNYGDEIGMHMHMYFDMVRAAGVTVRYSPAWNNEGKNSGDGYDVPCSAYTYEEFTQLLNWGKSQFEAHGLGTPISFRAGGWYLGLQNVHALETAGFKIDSSGRDAKFWGKGYIASPWSHGATTQPYKISTENQNSDYPSPRYDVWEMTDNGVDSYWYSETDMINAIEQNYDGGPLKSRKLVVILSHPHWFSIDFPKLQKFFAFTDARYYPEDKGPIMYTTLSNYYNILTTDPNPKYVD